MQIHQSISALEIYGYDTIQRKNVPQRLRNHLVEFLAYITWVPIPNPDHTVVVRVVLKRNCYARSFIVVYSFLCVFVLILKDLLGRLCDVCLQLLDVCPIPQNMYIVARSAGALAEMEIRASRQ